VWIVAVAAHRTCALFMSASLRPVAYSMAWDAPWDLGWVMRELYLFSPAHHHTTDVDMTDDHIAWAIPPLVTGQHRCGNDLIYPCWNNN
jgi:hypothetical protein